MKKRGHTKTWLTALIITVLMQLTGCMKEAMHTEPEIESVPLKGEICLTLNLSLDNDKSATKAESGNTSDEPARPGIDDNGFDENKISTIFLFFEELDETGNPVSGKPMIWFSFVAPHIAEDGTVNLPIPQGEKDPILTTGPKQIHIGANLTYEQAECFANGNREHTLPDSHISKFSYGLAEEYAPGRGIGLVKQPDGDYTRRDIAMFCSANETHRILLSESQEKYTCPGTFRMKRIVAKILVTCEVGYDGNGTNGEEGIGYCKLTGGMLNGQSPRGWIRQGDVKFLINSLNKKSFIQQQSSWNTDRQKWEFPDPNYENISGFFTVGANGIPVPTEKAKTNFYYNAVQTLNKYNHYYVGTIRHDSSRIPTPGNSNSDCYFEGLYCPENTFNTETISGNDDAILSNYEYPWPMITHVSITAKFTPKDLFVEKEMADYIDKTMPETDKSIRDKIKDLINGSSGQTQLNGRIVRIESPSEELSWAILNASMKRHYTIQEGNGYDEQAEGFPERTFCSVVDSEGSTLYYTYGAAKAIETEAGWGEPGNDDPKKLGSFKIMPQGKGYYYTYIDNRKPAEKGTPATYADSQIERNAYYILTISAFATEGRTGSEPSYIKVHTNVAKWKDGGSANIELQ